MNRTSPRAPTGASPPGSPSRSPRRRLRRSIPPRDGRRWSRPPARSRRPALPPRRPARHCRRSPRYGPVPSRRHRDQAPTIRNRPAGSGWTATGWAITSPTIRAAVTGAESCTVTRTGTGRDATGSGKPAKPGRTVTDVSAAWSPATDHSATTWPCRPTEAHTRTSPFRPLPPPGTGLPVPAASSPQPAASPPHAAAARASHPQTNLTVRRYDPRPGGPGQQKIRRSVAERSVRSGPPEVRRTAFSVGLQRLTPGCHLDLWLVNRPVLGAEGEHRSRHRGLTLRASLGDLCVQEPPGELDVERGIGSGVLGTEFELGIGEAEPAGVDQGARRADDE